MTPGWQVCLGMGYWIAELLNDHSRLTWVLKSLILQRLGLTSWWSDGKRYFSLCYMCGMCTSLHDCFSYSHSILLLRSLKRKERKIRNIVTPHVELNLELTGIKLIHLLEIFDLVKDIRPLYRWSIRTLLHRTSQWNGHSSGRRGHQKVNGGAKKVTDIGVEMKNK